MQVGQTFLLKHGLNQIVGLAQLLVISVKLDLIIQHIHNQEMG
jgi:hypothetical protein